MLLVHTVSATAGIVSSVNTGLTACEYTRSISDFLRLHTTGSVYRSILPTLQVFSQYFGLSTFALPEFGVFRGSMLQVYYRYWQ